MSKCEKTTAHATAHARRRGGERRRTACSLLRPRCWQPALSTLSYGVDARRPEPAALLQKPTSWYKRIRRCKGPRTDRITKNEADASSHVPTPL